MTERVLGAAFALLVAASGAAAAQAAVTSASGQDRALWVLAALMPGTGRDFAAVWETPRETSAQLPALQAAVAGQPVTFALLARGMQVRDGLVSLECRVGLIYPDGTAQMAIDGPCPLTRLSGPAADVYPAAVFDFGIPAALAGQTLGLHARLTDRANGASVVLRLAMPVIAEEG